MMCPSCKNKGLHDDLQKVFSSEWQKNIRKQDLNTAIEAAYRSKFGDDAYGKAVEFKKWLASQKNMELILVYLGEKWRFRN